MAHNRARYTCVLDFKQNTMENLELESRTLEDFRLYSSLVFKMFLSIRKKPTNGSFETLVAR